MTFAAGQLGSIPKFWMRCVVILWFKNMNSYFASQADVRRISPLRAASPASKPSVRVFFTVLFVSALALPGSGNAQAQPATGKAKPKTEVPKNDKLTATDLLGMTAAVGVLGALTVDATVGELFVRAYPSTRVANESVSEPPGSLELSCDTYRSASGNHMVAAATACHVKFMFVAKNQAYTLSGPFRAVETFEGRSCDEARKFCDAYRVTLPRVGRSIEIREKNKPIGSVDFSGLVPLYKLSK